MFYAVIYFLPDKFLKPLLGFEQMFCDVIMRLERSNKVRKKLNAFFLLSRLSNFLLSHLDSYKREKTIFPLVF
jgi:hypothetical protein